MGFQQGLSGLDASSKSLEVMNTAKTLLLKTIQLGQSS